MSIGGTCLWVPSLSSPVPSSLSAVTSHLSAVARHRGERIISTPRTISPLLTLPKEREPGASLGVSCAEMQRAGTTAENALTTPVPVRAAAPGPYRGGEIPSLDAVGLRPVASRDDLLPRVKLEIPGKSHTNFAISQLQAGPGRFGEAHAPPSALDASDELDKESTISPTDDRAETVASDENNKSPSLEKKKMKRFRLTHNQTRFLMSEFTRQAHPDAAHRERLSREIPGLTPRQVQVWFQNRRAKLKRLTTNDRERMLKSRALPDDFDTTKVLRTPFESKSTGQTPVASPQDYGAPNPDFASLRALRTDCFQRPSEDDYLVSPLSSASTAGTYMSSAGQGRTDGLPSSNIMFSRPAASASMHDLHRTIRNDFSITRSSSLSDASSQTSFHPGMLGHSRYGPSSNPSGLPYNMRPMEYGIPRHPGGMVTPYEQHQSFEGSVSPSDSPQGAHMTYDISSMGSQPQSYQPHLALSSQIPSHARPLSTLQSLPVSAPQEYRPFSYASPSGSIGNMPYTQSNASTLSLPTSFAPSESGSTAADSMQQGQPGQQGLESLRTKFGNPPFNYASYIQQ
ncbi:hypothetical protein N7462_008634 [Penicillium macrosclerotiorum]|uniref:uncharacterized protein n=1 Tax=Penicillium macrosclerotiorum TaxID=303699 RepID=UPI0025465E31|nr:uncharacterized protein N7462_008634 [Penicillium macrosclerotiorum]KAJ5675737.1 hypothetical protein N7462_008634 [Penicillium macrosclerotiorum]